MTDALPMPDMPERGESLPANRQSTGAYWAKHNPEQALQAEQLWTVEGLSVAKIALALGASKNTIRAYLDSRGLLNVDVDQIKKTGQLATLHMLRRIADAPESVPNSAVALTAKLSMDTAQLASGAPTQIVEHRHEHTITVPTVDDIRRFREVSKTGLGGEKMGQCGPAAAGPERLGAGPPPVVLEVVEVADKQPHEH